MVKKNRTVVIDNVAKLQLRFAYDYIFKDSPQNAKKFRDKILTSIKELVRNPEKHPPDKYKIDNDEVSELTKFINIEFPITFLMNKLLFLESDILK